MDSKFWRWLNILFLIGFTAALIIAWNANNNRINDIQKSRRESCEQTYRSMLQVFQPFFVKHPKGIQKKNQEKFNAIIQKKIAHCAVQVHATKVNK